jgi:hypothetical protein
MNETFNVVQFFPNETYEYLRGGHDAYGAYHPPVPAKEAVELAHSYTRPTRPGVMLGVIAKVMIEDQDGSCVFLWVNDGKGGRVVFPTREECEAARATP